MTKQYLIARLVLGASIALASLSQDAFADVFKPPIGGFATDGAVYAGMSPNASQPMYTTPEDAPGLYTWGDGQNYCSALQSFGHQDWRVPTQNELKVLYENRKTEALSGTFKETEAGSAGWYWSSEQGDGGQVWVMDFSDGKKNQDYQDDKSSLRCVRSGD